MAMTRREAMRLVGGGMIVSALPGCSAWSVTDRATAAWREVGAGSDPRLRALSYALLAPNAHNLQPWIADLRRPGEIVLSADTDRLLPMVDPQGRQTTMCQGTFLEVLDLALRAQAVTPSVELFPEGEYGDVPDGRPVARIGCGPGPAERDPLLEQVPRRRTNRKPFEPRPVEPAVLAALLATAIPPQVRVAGTIEPALGTRLAELAAQAFEVEVRTERTFLETVRVLRVGAEEIEAHRDGLAVTGFMPWLGRKLGLLDEAALRDPRGMGAKQAIADARRQAGTAQGWVWLTTEGNSRREQVQAGRAYVRLHLAATALGLAWQPMSQLTEEYPEMSDLRARFTGALGAAAGGGATVQMLARIGWAGPVAPSPRRELAELLRS